MSDLLSLAGLLAAAATILVAAVRRWWPRCTTYKPMRVDRVSIGCRRRRFHLGAHRTGPRRKPTTAFWRRDSLWQARRHPVRWWHRQRAMWIARAAVFATERGTR